MEPQPTQKSENLSGIFGAAPGINRRIRGVEEVP